MLPEIADAQRRVMNHFALFQFLVAKNRAQEGTLPGAIATDEADFDVVNQRDFGTIQ
jgi:hypothetical protein